MFFQWILCSGIFTVGFILWMIRGPTDHVWEPWACLGGILWCSGNMFVIPIVQCIGLGMGLVLWGSANMLTGWASGRFGWFGLTKQAVKHAGLNSAGVVVAVTALVLFMFVKPEAQLQGKDEKEDRLLGAINEGGYDEEKTVSDGGNGGGWISSWSLQKRRVVGVVMSLISGVLYGTNFDPPQYIKDNRYDSRFVMHSTNSTGFITGVVAAPNNLVDYAFPHFCGIFFASTLYFMIYCAYKRNQPEVISEICLPGYVSGILWAMAQVGWFIANENLQFPVAFPLVAVGPGLIGSLWGVFVFKEITGKRNFMFLVAAFAVSITSSTMIAMS